MGSGIGLGGLVGVRGSGVMGWGSLGDGVVSGLVDWRRGWEREGFGVWGVRVGKGLLERSCQLVFGGAFGRLDWKFEGAFGAAALGLGIRTRAQWLLQ